LASAAGFGLVSVAVSDVTYSAETVTCVASTR